MLLQIFDFKFCFYFIFDFKMKSLHLNYLNAYLILVITWGKNYLNRLFIFKNLRLK